MSDTSQGPGWWLASDGMWYPPEQAPANWPPPPPDASAGGPPPAYGTPPTHGVPPGYGTPPGYVANYAAPGYGYGGPPAAQSTNGFAIASMVLGILWVWWIGSLLALIFGYKAKGEIDRSQGRQGGRGMAIAGIVLGWIGMAMLVLIIAVAALGSSAETSFTDVGNEIGEMNSDPSDGWCNDDRYWQDPDC